MNNNYHQRVIVLNYSENDVPTFKTQAEVDAWHQALGRMVAYGLQRDAVDDSTQMVGATLSRNPTEVDFAYWPVALTVRDSYGYAVHTGTKSNVDQSIYQAQLLAKEVGRPFVMGAVLHSDGKWGYHS
jgi:hypothetical protein